jgi:branched-subunit amino acid transport protein
MNEFVHGVLTILGLAVVTFVTRNFFLFPSREVKMPPWLQRGLKVAPLAALAAVVAPEIVMTQGRLISTWQDARLPAVLAATCWYLWRPGYSGRCSPGWPLSCRCACCSAGERRASIEPGM